MASGRSDHAQAAFKGPTMRLTGRFLLTAGAAAHTYGSPRLGGVPTSATLVGDLQAVTRCAARRQRSKRHAALMRNFSSFKGAGHNFASSRAWGKQHASRLLLVSGSRQSSHGQASIKWRGAR